MVCLFFCIEIGLNRRICYSSFWLLDIHRDTRRGSQPVAFGCSVGGLHVRVSRFSAISASLSLKILIIPIFVSFSATKNPCNFQTLDFPGKNPYKSCINTRLRSFYT